MFRKQPNRYLAARHPVHHTWWIYDRESHEWTLSCTSRQRARVQAREWNVYEIDCRIARRRKAMRVIAEGVLISRRPVERRFTLIRGAA